MKLLALDSSAGSASVCLWEDGRILGEFYVNIKQTHSQTLMVMTEQLLQCTGTPLDQIDCFAVSAGPGSFTGVRIGVSCVKGMAMGVNKPCIGVSTLEAMARNCTGSNGILCAVMDARCQQVYNALFRMEDGVLTRITEDRAISIAALAAECAELREPIYLVGDGAALCDRSHEFLMLSQVRLLREPLQYQRASGVAAAAGLRLQAGETVSPGELQPVYLRLPQAERELKQRQQKEVME